jgi:hypothetical protein
LGHLFGDGWIFILFIYLFFDSQKRHPANKYYHHGSLQSMFSLCASRPNYFVCRDQYRSTSTVPKEEASKTKVWSFKQPLWIWTAAKAGVPLSNWDVGQVTDMSKLFSRKYSIQMQIYPNGIPKMSLP